MEFFNYKDPEIISRITAENNLAFAFPALMAIVPGHILICPKRRVSKAEDLASEELSAIFDLQKKLKKAMIAAFDAQGFNYAWNDGKMAGQSVNHFHLHMLPRKEGDSGIYEYEPRKYLYRPNETSARDARTNEELKEVVSLIRKNL